MIKKIFGQIKMSWLKVIIFALITGVYTGLIMLVPSLKNTSFQDIGMTFEWWVIFAVIVVVNCEKGWEAALKCFVFFLISQPVIYGVEILFGSMTFELAKMYYVGGIWLPLTFATLPGGFVAWLCKKQNTLGAAVLGLGNTIEALMAVYYARSLMKNPPHHLLTIISCFAAIVVMTLCIQKEKKGRIIAFAVPAALAVLVVIAEALGVSLPW